MRHILLFLFLYVSLFLYSQTKEDTVKLYFETDHSQIETEHENLLNKLNSLNVNEIRIYGFTDSVGSLVYNRVLSNKRAYSAYFYLLNHGVEIPTIKDVKGLGEVDKNTPDFESLDICRKVEIYFSYNQTSAEKTPQNPKPILTKPKEEVDLEEQMQTAEVGESLVIKNIHFYPGSHVHLPQSEPEMEALLSVLINNPSIKIEIQGHICCQGGGIDGFDSDTGDQYLSVNRAYHIYQFLISRGISADRLSYKGFASTRKLFPIERNEMERIANRRVEIKILER